MLVLRLESFGVPYEIRIDRAAIDVERVREALPPFSRATRRPPLRRYAFSRELRRRVLRIDAEPPVRCPTVRAAQDALEGDLALFVAASAPRHVFIHAGVVAVDGQALLLPGRTMTGKSTLVAALVARGATYFSDEYAVLDGRGRVLPYPRRLSMRRPHGLPRRTLPQRVGQGSASVGWVVGSRFDRERTAIELTPLSAGRTAMALLANAVAARLAPARVLKAVRQVASRAAGHELLRGEARDTANELLPLLAERGMVNAD